MTTPRRGHPEALNAVTLGVTAMASSHAFYAAMGFELAYGGPEAAFSSYRIGAGTFLNLQLVDTVEVGWGRFIVFVDDVDAMHERAVAAGYAPTTDPVDAPWHERYFHIDDPDGHEVSFARPLPTGTADASSEA